MALSRARRLRRRSSAGFTLVEIVAALAIVALLAALALPALPLSTSRARVEAFALQTASLLIADRAAAVRRGTPVVARLDARARAIQAGSDGAVLHFPEDVDFDAVLAESCEGHRVVSAIVFLPNGMSCGGAILIGRGDAVYQIRVNWLTGAVDVASGRGVSP